mmetsp:Transcript_20709/g.39360  ORF Transcript_20709/g.39360 Transcript_20709/m.39360 type:complete len:211 (+) Transcript_20709:785-1417(+)
MVALMCALTMLRSATSFCTKESWSLTPRWPKGVSPTAHMWLRTGALSAALHVRLVAATPHSVSSTAASKGRAMLWGCMRTTSLPHLKSTKVSPARERTASTMSGKETTWCWRSNSSWSSVSMSKRYTGSVLWYTPRRVTSGGGGSIPASSHSRGKANSCKQPCISRLSRNSWMSSSYTRWDGRRVFSDGCGLSGPGGLQGMLRAKVLRAR